MRRRKLLIGLGSLAAGSAATVGTGALSSITAERDITGRVVGDEKAYLEINGFDDDGLEHSWMIEKTSSGQFALNVGEDPDYDKYDGNTGIGNEEAEGLNQNAVSTFDEVFRVHNDGHETMDVFFRDTPNWLSFYGHRGDNDVDADPQTDSLMGSSNSVVLYPFDEEGDPSDAEDPGNAELLVGMEIDLSGYDSLSDVSGSFTVVADENTANDTGGSGPNPG